MLISSDEFDPRDGIDGWTLVEFQHTEIENNKLFVYRHPKHGEVEIIRPPNWRRKK